MNNQINGQVQDNKNLGRWSIRYSLQSNEHQNQLNRRHKKDETKILQLERMCLTALNQVLTQTQPHQCHQTQGSLIGVRRTLHDFLVPGL